MRVRPFVGGMGLFVSCLLLLGCGSLEKERALWSTWAVENEHQNQAIGERIYDKDFDRVFSSIVTGLAFKGFSIKNMEKTSGYILAEGPNPIPIEKLQALAEELCNEMNKVSSRKWSPRIGNDTKAITVSALRLEQNKTKVKIRISTVSIDGTYTSKYYSSYPPMLAEEFNEVWRAIEKQIFLDEHLDKAN